MGTRPNSRRLRTKTCFVRVLLNGFMKELLIPRKYVMRHGETLGEECVLCPTHTHDSWPVRTKLINDELYFRKGWREFAKHHSLEFGDMLIFHHVKNSEFEVDVVDKSGTSKETLASRKELLMKDTAPIPTNAGRQKKAILESAALTAAEALVLSSEYPSFIKTMKAVYVQRTGGYLHVPLDFVKEHMKDYQGNVKIVLLDKAWTVKAVRRPCETRTIFGSGWNDLARENSLQVRDVCVFQLIHTKYFTLKLTIFSHISGKIQKQKKCAIKLKSPYSEITLKSEELSNKAEEEAKRIQSKSKHPSVVIVMKRAYVKNGYLHVPFAFQKEMCKKMSVNEVKLLSLGEEWKMMMKYVSEQYRIYKGWGRFVKEKSIEVGDVCVLELLDRDEHVINISIFKCNY
ncbi:B3 domain-containing protein Os03g0212300-like [Apium graveolens]|uniref:B3 domain-containing protein Os03g0212300-like n=1 Tax=Apium graveolens TaxID=4045 RepID=UPI003D794DBC